MVLSLVMGLILSFLYAACFAEESITITTYYPSPYGSYRQLAADQIAIGSTYRNPTYADGSLYVQDNVGIGTTSPQTPAPNALTGNLDVNDIYLRSTSQWVSQIGWYVPTSIIATTATHNGNFGGYQAMYSWIQSNGCSGYHVCDSTEITRYYQIHVAGTFTGWFNGGVFDTNPSAGSVDDCCGWTSVEYTSRGNLWLQNHVYRDECAAAHAVMCCK